MINADEHKKLLAQITELEKTSVNYFDVEKEFFLIDSNNLSQVRPRLYGYSIQRSGIYEDDNLTPEAIASLDGRGCYIYVDVKGGEITIKQDLNGCWGIYLFRHGDYFALSNSFFRLLDHIKLKYPLTLNRDYCNYQVIDALCSIAYLETAVNEIQIVDRSALITIDIQEKNLHIELIDYKEYSVPLDSKEGITTLDRWIEFWSNVFRGISQHTKFISADLSGGFDSRISLAILLHSNVDLSKIRINSIKDDLHTHKEDYEIANKIAEHYGFQLNKSLPARQFLNYSLTDVLNFDSYGWQTFTNIPKYSPVKLVDKMYCIDGSRGEMLRKRWHMSPKIFLETQYGRINHYYLGNFSDELFHSIKNILESGFRAVCDKHNIKNPDSIEIPQLLYHATWSRHHFGKGVLSNYLHNVFTFSPAIDPELCTLKLNSSECPDYNLLIALIFTRYAPDLLTFPFNSNRSIAPETIEYAKKINERFPLVKKDKASISGGVFHLQPRDTQAEKILSSSRNNPNIPSGLPETCLKATFESSKTYGLFTAHFDEEFYRYAASFYDSHPFERLRLLYAVVGVAKVLEYVEISQRNYPKYQDMKRFLEQDFATIHADVNKSLRKFQNYITARIDVKLMSTEGDFKISSMSDDRASITKPSWFQQGGIGYQIESYAGNMEFIVKATVDAPIHLQLKGRWVPAAPKDKTKLVPYWIDYTNLTVNGRVIFDKITPAWHNKSYNYSIGVKAGEEVKIKVEWLPHRSDTLFATPQMPVKTFADKFLPYVTSRVDIQMVSKTAGSDFQILSMSDDRAAITKPGWFQQGGIGYQIESYAGNMEFIVKATVDAPIYLQLKGRWIPEQRDKTKLIPYWIDYTKLTVNGRVIFNNITPAWHNKPYRYNMNVKAGEEIKIQIEWLPHMSDT